LQKLLLALALALIASFIGGCSTGEISDADIKRNMKAQADWIKAHPPPPDTRVEN